jgi:hypothetical protein
VALVRVKAASVGGLFQADHAMCDKCTELDPKIAHVEDLAARLLDPQAARSWGLSLLGASTFSGNKTFIAVSLWCCLHLTQVVLNFLAACTSRPYKKSTVRMILSSPQRPVAVIGDENAGCAPA